MSWKKYFQIVPTQHTPGQIPTSGGANDGDQGGSGTAAKYSSYLPEVYAGHPNRIQRYYQYDDMDGDSDVNAALDTIADFCTQSEEQTEDPFAINYLAEANETEVKLLKTMLTKWVKVNDFKARLWYIFRNAVKYGDTFFLRDPETGEWLWLDQFSVLMVKVDDQNGKEADEYVVRGLDINRRAKYASENPDISQYSAVMGMNGMNPAATNRPLSASSAAGNFQMVGSHIDQRQQKLNQQGNQQELFVVDAKHIVHLSLSVGLDVNWPFGSSVLQPIFKSYKQKELLEDAIIIYRVQRAPERRVFYIDVGNLPPPRAMAHVQAVKNEIHQRRIPNRSGGGSGLDAAYNPLSIMDDFFFAQSSEGRGSKVETLPGGDSLGEIGDLDYFTKKMARGLRIPPSYLGLTEEQTAYQDGKLGAAMIQEYRFNKYCMRLQNLLAPVFDQEFKKFVAENGVAIDTSIFEVQFNPPQNFTKYRQIELDSQQINVYAQVAENRRLSERFKLKRFLNLTDEEILENERQWGEENAAKLKKATGATPAETASDADLGSIGIRSGGDMDFGMPGADEMGDDPMAGDAPAAGAGVDPMAMAGGAGGAAAAAPAAGAAPAPGGAKF